MYDTSIEALPTLVIHFNVLSELCERVSTTGMCCN